jgi:hypothetical protein
MKFKWIVVLVLSIILLVCVTSIIVNTRTKSSKFVGTMSLTTTLNKDWNIIEDNVGRRYIQVVNGNTLKVTYPVGSYIPSSPFRGGFQFYAQPKVFPSQHVSFSYQVLFPLGFNWVKGGKLPGLWIGNRGANGGNHMQDGSSFRLMWRTEGAAEAYLYLPHQPNQSFYEQKGYVNNDQYGESLWRGQFNFQTGVWNNVTLYIGVNTPNTANGLIRLTINNTTQEMNNIVWINSNKQQKVNGIMMHTFFGGNDVSWATPIEQNIYFRGFTVSNA